MKAYIDGDENKRAQEERGVALLTTVVCSALFMLLGLSLTFSSLTEFKMSTEYAAREQALLIADAGFNLTQGILRGNDLSDLLSTVTQVDQYLNFPVPTERELRWSTSIGIPCLRLRPFRSILPIHRLPSGLERSRVC